MISCLISVSNYHIMCISLSNYQWPLSSTALELINHNTLYQHYHNFRSCQVSQQAAFKCLPMHQANMISLRSWSRQLLICPHLSKSRFRRECIGRPANLSAKICFMICMECLCMPVVLMEGITGQFSKTIKESGSSSMTQVSQ